MTSAFFLTLIVCCTTLPIVSAQPPSPAAAALQEAVDAAISSGSPRVDIAPGVYAFGATPLRVGGASHLTIGGHGGPDGVTLLFAPGAGVTLANSSDVELHDFNIDYAPLPYVRATVLAVSARNVTVELAQDSLTFEQLVAMYPPHDIWPPGSVFAAPTSGGGLVASICDWGKAVLASRLANGSYAVACPGGRALPGDTFVAPTRVGFTLALADTTRVAVRDVDIHAASYMAVTEFRGDGGNVYERLRLVPRDASMPLSSNADGFHSSGMRLGPTLRGVVMTGLLDDYFNVHNTFQLLVGSAGPLSLLVGDYQLFAGDSALLYGTQKTLDRVVAGDALSVFPLNTFTYPPLSSGLVASIAEVPNATAALAAAYAAASAAAIATPCSACHAGLNPYATAQLYNVTFAAPVSAPAPPALVSVDSIAAAGAVILGCNFSGSGSNLGRFKSSGGLITSSVWSDTLSQNLEIEALQNWLEGALGVHNVTISDNIFHGTTASPIHTFGSADIIMANNSFLPRQRAARQQQPSAAELPCDVFAAGGTPCVAAHSVVRALYAAYAGPLYELQRAADNATTDIGPLAPGGVANAAAQDNFCAGADLALPPLGTVVNLIPASQPTLSFRHCDAQGFATPSDGNDDHSFTIVAALNGAPGSVSFRSVNYPAWYVAPVATAEPGRLGIVQAPAAADASWVIAAAAGSPGAFTLTLVGRGQVALGANLTGSCSPNYQPPSAGVFLSAVGGAWRIAPAGALPACSISRIYDQSGRSNHLAVAPAGGAVPRGDRPVDATALPVMLSGARAYGAYFVGGQGYRIDNSSGVARGDNHETIYMVTAGGHYNGGCCFGEHSLALDSLWRMSCRSVHGRCMFLPHL